MITQVAETEKPSLPLWHYVPLGEYKVPEATMAHAIKGGIMGLWNRFRPQKKRNEDPLRPEESLQLLTETTLDHIAPEPDCKSASMALKAELLPWIGKERKRNPGIFVISPPHGNNAKILTQLAEDLRWRVVSPPTEQEILGQKREWTDRWTDQKGPWILPELERCYLRHARGLDLVRSFFEKLQSGLLGIGVIGCDSWAWAYLNQVICGIPSDTYVAQAFDHERLAHWFQKLSTTKKKKDLLFRQSDDGTYVLPPPPELASPSNEAVDLSDFLQNLAAHSLGISGIAWSLWRTALRTVPEETILREAAKDGKARLKSTFWVLPWDQLKQLPLPVPMKPADPLVLHNLLLHNGLSSDILSRILPLSSGSVVQALLGLQEMGFLEQKERVWRVSAQGYPAVRRALHGEGYLVDDLQ